MTPACINRMPGPGTSPRTRSNIPTINITQLEVQSQERGAERDKPVWVQGSSEEDNRRYRELMAYIEEKRVETRELLLEEMKRKEKAKERENSWTLLRMSTAT